MADESASKTQGRGAAALPPRFDADVYLARNRDLALSPDEAAGHYAAIGRAEGRIASPLALRENLIDLIDDGRSALEIGPFCSPLLRGPAIAYLDVLDADQLRARAVQIGLDPTGCPAHIDYVGGLEQVRRRFDAVISSHAIEHQPDLVHHLQQIERILQPDGLFCLIIPDKRYCLDHYIAESTVAQVLQAHREQRRVHSLASVVEHVALTTHNDLNRHWAGDHGEAVPSDRAQRVEAAVRAYDMAVGDYVDVHAWYFTPDRFREIVDTLGALGLTRLEVAGVYDPAHGRNEFCAVLRFNTQARLQVDAGQDERGILFLQTADADRYAPMLALTATNIREYCRRHGHGYESFVGIRRGFHPWQATFNRIPMLVDLMERGFTGWAIYIDADAYIQDLDFDLAAYLAGKADRAAIFATSGVTGEAWDVNAGVAFINLGHPLGRELVRLWAESLAAHSDDFLRDAAEWIGPGNDQDLLHQLLRNEPAIADVVLVEQMAFINGPHASFIRQHLRTMATSFEERLRGLSVAVAETLRRSGQAAPASADSGDRRWSGRLAHPEGRLPALVEAPVPAARPDAVATLRAAWLAAGGAEQLGGLPPHLLGLGEALARNDLDAVAGDLAAFGKAPVAQGILGGSRQHARAHSREFSERLARWTYDKLVSLAEAVGAMPLENPEGGRWAVNTLTDPAEIFASIETALGADLAPPPQIGGYLGVGVGRGLVLHMRMIDAIHAAWRLRQLSALLGVGIDGWIVQIGGGAGLDAFYARRLGLTGYRLFDTPLMNLLQNHVLAGSGLAQPLADLAGLQRGDVDLLFNADAAGVLCNPSVRDLLARAEALDIRHLLSINEEAGSSEAPAVATLIEEVGGWRRVSRHRHWLRAGFAEEHFIRTE